MALIVVGGQSKHVGKTTLICDIIRTFVNARWTAAKITSHVHQVEGCCVIASDSAWSICEQEAADVQVDTARYIKAGAVRSLLVCAESSSLPAACSALKKEIAAAANTIVESTTAAEELAPDLFLLVADPESSEMKASAKQQFALADGFVVRSVSRTVKIPNLARSPSVYSALKGACDPGLVERINGLLKSFS